MTSQLMQKKAAAEKAEGDQPAELLSVDEFNSIIYKLRHGIR